MIGLVGRALYLLVGFVLAILLLNPAKAQTVTRAEFDALKAQHMNLVRYTADLASGMLRMDEKRRLAEAQVEAQRVVINIQNVYLRDFTCKYNALTKQLASGINLSTGNAGTPPIVNLPGLNCIQPGLPAPSISNEDPLLPVWKTW